MKPNLFIAGLDLGQSADYTALAVCERVSLDPSTLDVRHLERFRLGTPYPDIVAGVTERFNALPGKPVLVVDATGVGAAVVDMLHDLRPVQVVITGGDKATRAGARWRVPKRDLVGITKVLLQERRLRFAEDLPETPILVKELLNFQVKIDPKTAHDSYAVWREGLHDDLVLAVAMAAWWGARYNKMKVVTIVVNRDGYYTGSSGHNDEPGDMESLPGETVFDIGRRQHRHDWLTRSNI